MTERDRPGRADAELDDVLASLPGELAPGDDLEERTLRRVRGVRSRRNLLLSAAAAALFAFGFGAGAWLSGAGQAPSSDGGFLLLLYVDGDYQAPRTGSELDRIEEYRNWARQVARRGIPIRGERLAGEGLRLTGGQGGVRQEPVVSDTLSGYFVVGVTNRREAEEVARSCPHLRYGGRLVVKAILPT